MASRYDKRAISSGDVAEDRPSLKSFKSSIEKQHKEEERKRLAAHQAAAAQDLVKPIASLTINDDETAQDDDSRTLQDRLTTGSDEASNAAIASLLVRALQLHHGELMIQLDPSSHGNLHSRPMSSLFDAPDAAVTKDDSAVLPKATVDAICATFETIATQIGARVSVLHNPFDDEGKRKALEGPGGTETASSANDEVQKERWRGKALRLLLRRVGDGAEDINEVRVCVVGNVDAGKSSLLGVLTKGRLDDGRGRARVSLFRHKHEIESGRTSSVGIEVLGFGPNGQEVLPEGHAHALKEKNNEVDNGPTSATKRQQLSWEEIASKAHKIISFSDLAGHERYLKTTLFGLTATSPDFVLLIVGANAGLLGMSKEHLSVALALSIPVVVVVTKVDMTPPNVLEQTLKQLNKVLRSPGCRKQPVYVKDVGMAAELAQGFVAEKACPVFLVSNVTGEGLSLLRSFLNFVPTASEGGAESFPLSADFEFSVSDVFSVPFVGSVVSGVILAGTVAIGDTVLLGPDSLGAFTPTVIKSIQRKRVPVNSAEAGQSVSFALKRVKRAAIRKGMVLLAKTEVPPAAVRRFEGQVLVLYHNSLISPHYQAMLHVGSVRQTVQIESIVDKPCIRTGDRATVVLRFIKYGEFLRVGDRFLFREGRTKALGVVTKLLPTIKEPPGTNHGH